MSARREDLDTATVSDALDRLRIGGQAFGIGPLEAGMRLQGTAFTVRLVPASGRGGTVGDFIDEVAPGSVVVLDNGGRRDATVWGDLLTTTASRMGLAGTVIDGVCRDTERTRALGYPLFSRGAYMRTGKDRVQAAETRGLVSLGTASVAHGDLVVGDADGVVVVPADRVVAVLEIADEIREVEDRIRAAVEAGVSLRDAREEAGYHRLQRSAGP